MTKPGYKMTEIAEIPENWNVVSLDNMIEILDSRRVPLSETERANRKGTIPYCGANGIIDYIDDYIFDEEAVLIAEDGGNYGKFQNKSYIMTGKYWVNNHAHVFRGRSELLENKFIIQWLNFSDISPYVSGSTRTKLNQEMLKRILVPIPPLQEQKKIAEILFTADETIQKVNEEIALTEKLKKGLMQTLLAKGIGHTKFKMTEIGEIPVEWDLVPLTKLATYVNGMAFKPSDWKKRGIPIVRIENLNNPSAPFNYFDDEVDNKFLLNDGDILLSWSASLGVYVWNRGRAVLNQHIFKVVPNETANKYYLFWALHNSIETLSKVTHGSTMKHFQKGELERAKIALPSLSEQQKIAEILSTADDKLKLLRNKKDRLEKLKKGLMNDLLTGRVRVKV